MEDMQLKMGLDIEPFVKSLGLAQGESIDFGKNLGKDFDGINVTVKDLLERLDDLKVKFQEAPIGGEAWHRWKNESKEIGDQLRRVKDEFNQATPSVNTSSIQVGAFRTAITQSTYALREINPTLGNVASSLSPLISGFNTSAVRGKGFSAMLGAVGSQIMGPAGILIGIGLLTTAITTWIKSSDDAEKSTKSLKDEVKSLVSEYENLMRIQVKEKMREWTEKYEEQTEAIKKRLSFWQKIGSIIELDRGLLGMMGLGDLSDTEIENLRKLRTEEEALNKALSDKGRIPQLEATIKYMQELKRKLPDSAPQASFDAYNASIKKLQKELDGLNGRSEKTKEIYTKDSAIRNEISKINMLLNSQNLTAAEYLRLLNLRVSKVKELTVVTEDLIKAEDNRNKTRFDNDIKSGLKGPFNIQPIESLPRPQVFKETNIELERMLLLSDTLTTSFNAAGNAVASAAASGINLFKTQNSLLQIFITSLIRAAAEALILKGITTALNFLGSAFGLPFLGSAVSGVASGGNAPLINPSGTGLSNVSLGSNSASFRTGNYNISPIIQQVPVVLDSRVKGKDIYLTQRKQESYKRKYYGAVNG